MGGSHPKWLGSLAVMASMTVVGGVSAQDVPLVPVTQKVEIHLAKQSLGDALTALGKQTGLNIVVDSTVGREVIAPGLDGKYTPAEALRKILESTGLRVKYLDKSTVAVVDPRSTVSSNARTIGARGMELAEAAGPVSDGEGSPDQPSSDGAGYSSDESSADKIAQVIVTGTHIRGAAADSSPVTIYSRKDIEQTGASTVQGFLRTVPQNFSSIDASTGVYGTISGTAGPRQNGGNSYAGAGVNLHGLGVGATLTLINGQRMSSGGAAGSFVDVSMIPLSAVERIEVLSDGASAVYGSDAIAGVVNFVLRKNFEGAETTLRYGAADGNVDNEFNGSQTFGHSWSSGNALVVYEFGKQDGLLSTDRSFVTNQGIPSHIIPEQKRNSMFATVRQDVVQGTTLSGSAFYNDRDFDQGISSPVGGGNFALASASGTSKSFGGSAALEQNLPYDWRADLSGNVTKSDQSSAQVVQTQTTTGVPTYSLADTQLASAELRADGPVAPMPGGLAKVAVGAAFRSESLTNASVVNTKLTRHVRSAFSELLLPFVEENNARPGMARVEVSLAVRYEDYSDVGSSTDPKIGLLWSPVRGLNIRGTYARSFQAPGLNQLVPNPSYYTFITPDPASSTGSTNTLFDISGGNPGLGPEKAKSWTGGLDIRPPSLFDLSITATYFSINFDGRIAVPPVTDSEAIFSQTATLGPFINRSPNPDDVAAAFATGQVSDFAGGGAGAVQATFDERLLNIQSSKESGIDVTGSYKFHPELGDVGVFLAGSYLLHNDMQSLSSTPAVALLNTVGQPVKLRARGGVNWSKGGFGSSLAVNYTDSYDNNLLTPTGTVASWTTADVQLSYQFDTKTGPELLRGLGFTLNALNLTNANPPYLAVPATYRGRYVGYDPYNASPVGRFISIGIRKTW